MSSITQILSAAAEAQLRLHLAGEVAETVAQQVAEAQAKAVLSELETFLNPAPARPAPAARKRRPAAATNGHAKPAARRKAAASAEAASSGAVGPGGTHSRAFTVSARNTMSEKKKLYWALQRLASGRKPLPGDDEAINRSKSEGTYDALFARANSKVRAEKKAKKASAAGTGIVLSASTLSEKLAM